MDEFGNNINQKYDKLANKKFAGQKGRIFFQYSATDYNRFTVIFWIAETGELVMVAVIFFRETLRDEWKSGIDVLSKYLDPDADMPKEFCSGLNGEGRVFQFILTCAFHGKTIHFF